MAEKKKRERPVKKSEKEMRQEKRDGMLAECDLVDQMIGDVLADNS